jgi:hypothetical protein
MSVLQKAKEHYHSTMSGEMKSIYVEEWQETVYFKPNANFAQQGKILELHNKGKIAEALVETLMQRAMTAEGKRMFNFGDKDALLREVDPEIIVRIVGIINGTEKEVDQALGN